MLLKRLLFVLLVTDALILNIIVGYLFYQGFPKSSPLEENTIPSRKFESNTLLTTPPNFTCDEGCKQYITAQIAETLARVTVTITPNATTAPSKSAAAKITRVSYVPVPGSGTTLQTSWVDLSGTDFYFDKNEFIGFVDAVLEANIKLLNGNGEAFVRIYDVTHGVAVSGSELKTGSQTSVLLTSDKLQFYSGKNLYRIQARSLTADTTVFESGRLKVISLE